jgi:hypothetical protein
MKNCTVVTAKGSAHIQITGMPPLHGWAIKYLSGIEEKTIKPGFWLSMWDSTTQGGTEFAFHEELFMVFNDEAYARGIPDFLRTYADVETEAVKV